MKISLKLFPLVGLGAVSLLGWRTPAQELQQEELQQDVAQVERVLSSLIVWIARPLI